jgi:hypothetical protein
LIPKKAKEFKKSTAEETGFSQDLVNSFLDFYWERVRKDMSDLVYPKILVPCLGTFKIKHWKLDETKEHYDQILRRIEGKFEKYKMYKDINDKVQKIENVKLFIEKEKIRLEKKLLKKNESNKNNMEEQIPNMGRYHEQTFQEQKSGEDIQEKNEDM